MSLNCFYYPTLWPIFSKIIFESDFLIGFLLSCVNNFLLVSSDSLIGVLSMVFYGFLPTIYDCKGLIG